LFYPISNQYLAGVIEKRKLVTGVFEHVYVLEFDQFYD